jgi:hypothetical protein
MAIALFARGGILGMVDDLTRRFKERKAPGSGLP